MIKTEDCVLALNDQLVGTWKRKVKCRQLFFSIYEDVKDI